MKLILKIAQKTEIKKVQEFFEKYLDENNPGITNGEFLCPFGIDGAIKRGQVVILKNKENIVGALRFYLRKRDNIVSVYQFALEKNFRGKGLIEKRLKKTGYKNFEVACFVNSEFSEYYKKTGWIEFSRNEKIVYFRKEI